MHLWCLCILFFFFFFNDTATTEIYTLSLHDALPIFDRLHCCVNALRRKCTKLRLHLVQHVPIVLSFGADRWTLNHDQARSEEHTSELQSRQYLVCRLLLEKKKTTTTNC